jgi:hypothetical protein
LADGIIEERFGAEIFTIVISHGELPGQVRASRGQAGVATLLIAF